MRKPRESIRIEKPSHKQKNKRANKNVKQGGLGEGEPPLQKLQEFLKRFLTIPFGLFFCCLTSQNNRLSSFLRFCGFHMSSKENSILVPVGCIVSMICSEPCVFKSVNVLCPILGLLVLTCKTTQENRQKKEQMLQRLSGAISTKLNVTNRTSLLPLQTLLCWSSW